MTMTKTLLNVTAAAALLTSSAHGAARFSGGLCASQGNWLQTSLQQSELVSNAIQALRNDPSCKALISAVESSPKFDAASRQAVTDGRITSYANFNRELSALSDYLKPSRLGGLDGMPDKQFQDLVYNVVFNKSYDAIKNIQADPDMGKLTDMQRSSLQDVGLRMQAFLQKSEEIANMTMATAQNIVRALPESKLCLDNRPSEAIAIFSSVVHGAASLVSGGRVNGVGEFLASLMNYSREMNYVSALAPIERARFEASVSCLIESTSESYCAMQDAEDALDFMKGIDRDATRKAQTRLILANTDADPVANPLGGLIILMRDIPVIQSWMQKVLFGIDPRLSIEAKMKNDYWQSFLNFIMSVNSLQADFRDKEKLYLDGAETKSKAAKLSQIRDIHDQIMGNIAGGGGGPGVVSNGISFYTRTRSADAIRFYLIGLDSIPADFNPEQRSFDTLWNNYTNNESHGFNNPDQLLQTIKSRLWSLMDQAKSEANAFFAQRMVVDPQNLVTEAMKGPGVSPYQGFEHLRVYYTNVAKKLAASAKALENDPEQRVRRRLLLAQIPLLRDSARRLEKIIASLDKIASIPEDADENQMIEANREVMNIIYDTGNMLVSRDSFFGTRMQTALQADLSDTLWSNRNLTDRQSQMLYSVGSDIVLRLSNFFGDDPTTQRTDLSQAKVIQITNLKSVEQLFAKTMYHQIIELHCQLNGGVSCTYSNTRLDPSKDPQSVAAINENIRRGKAGQGLVWKWTEKLYKPTEDSYAHEQLLAKLCVQTLAFENRDLFSTLCAGTKLISEFAESSNRLDLNLDYDAALAQIKAMKAETTKGHIDRARGQAVCSMRSYLRKNHIFQMYKDFTGSQQ